MDNKNIVTAILLSMAILLGYQYFFAPPTPVPPAPGIERTTEAASPGQPLPAGAPASESMVPAGQGLAAVSSGAAAEVLPEGRDIPVETALYSAVVSETGGGIKSFKLKGYNETLDDDADFKELVTTDGPRELPLYFTWGAPPQLGAAVPVYMADRETLVGFDANGEGALTLTSSLTSGITLTRSMLFHEEDYLIELVIDVHNASDQALQGAPYLSLTNRPFSAGGQNQRFLFQGPALLVDDVLQEIKVDDLEEGPKTVSGKLNWLAYEDTYFMTSVIPLEAEQPSVHLSLSDKDKVATLLSGAAVVIPPQGHQQYKYTIYFGPKKLATLKKVGSELHRIVNFGWFDVMAKPVLYLLNFFHRYVGNYGVAIILVTVLIKLLFWPIASRGMKSMKNMQKVQPKMAKLREKYKDDKERLNQEMINLYKTYKVNPLGGCLPMVLQIPVFFALYKVLLQTIELRHAPFMLWITDLSAPDRLPIGFDLPFLGGLPVLTLLMGGSMFLQQKMTPTSADPAQAKVMMFLPVIFTFMFLNFASGLVLYWFVNNLLSMGQQYMINRQVD